MRNMEGDGIIIKNQTGIYMLMNYNPVSSKGQ